MNGLNLEPFLRIIQTDPAAWRSLATGIALLLLILWAGHARRHVLRRCLLLSLILHLGLVVYGGPQALRWLNSGPNREIAPPREPSKGASTTRIELLPSGNRNNPDNLPLLQPPATSRELLRSAVDQFQAASLPDLPHTIEVVEAPPPLLARAEPDPTDSILPPIPPPEPAAPPLQTPSTKRTEPPPTSDEASIAPLETRENAPFQPLEPNAPPPPVALLDTPEPTTFGSPTDTASRPTPPASFTPTRLPAAIPRLNTLRAEDRFATPARSASARSAHDMIESIGPVDLTANASKPTPNPQPGNNLQAAVPTRDEPLFPGLDDTPSLIPNAVPGARVADPRPAPLLAAAPTRSPLPPAEISIPRRSASNLNSGGFPTGPETRNPSSARPLPAIPEVYRSRVAPNRSSLALSAGATPASEEAVQRALAWLARHQDQDGRWNAGIRRGPNGVAARGDSAFNAHCPPGDICSGECFYWEADTAMTGLALLAFLGAGHTHLGEGPHTNVVKRGLDFLLQVQKPDGDLRGASIGVGMYCHAIASLAICEAYALTRDISLRLPAERAVEFLTRARTSDGLAWRYQPGDRFAGDTSILGWAVMVLKSAREVGIAVPDDVHQGALTWLDRVATGPARGLAMYRPTGMSDGGRPTPTMTAEAWFCRQFLGSADNGPANEEAADYLLQHRPDRTPLNLYYWYYATLAMFQHGGAPWSRWNESVREQLVRRQSRGGHADGSWDPALCKDTYDATGGRVYTTALATLTLEVYYRYLKLYSGPSSSNPTLDDGPIVP